MLRFLILQLQGMRIRMFQLSGSYFRASGVGGEDLEFQLNTGPED